MLRFGRRGQTGRLHGINFLIPREFHCADRSAGKCSGAPKPRELRGSDMCWWIVQNERVSEPVPGSGPRGRGAAQRPLAGFKPGGA